MPVRSQFACWRNNRRILCSFHESERKGTRYPESPTIPYRTRDRIVTTFLSLPSLPLPASRPFCPPLTLPLLPFFCFRLFVATLVFPRTSVTLAHGADIKSNLAQWYALRYIGYFADRCLLFLRGLLARINGTALLYARNLSPASSAFYRTVDEASGFVLLGTSILLLMLVFRRKRKESAMNETRLAIESTGK